MTRHEFIERARQARRRNSLITFVWIFGLVAVLGGSALGAQAVWGGVGANHASWLAGLAAAGTAILPVALFTGGVVLARRRLLPDDEELNCPACGEPLTSAAHLVMASGRCPACGARVFSGTATFNLSESIELDAPAAERTERSTVRPILAAARHSRRLVPVNI